MITIKNIALSVLFIWATSLFCPNIARAGIPIEHWTQASGAEVFLLQSPAIPMLDVQLDFDAGSRRDPPEQAGLARASAAMAAKGLHVGALPGESAMDENALGEAWADLGASFFAHVSSDRMSFSLRSLTEPDLLAKAVQLASRQLAEPAFAAEVWQRERETMQASIREANTRPATLAGRALTQAVYGTHPYGFEATEASLQRIEVPHMAAWYRQLILPCRAKVSVVGAVSRAQADALVAQLLGRLVAQSGARDSASQATRCLALPAVPEVPALTQASEQRLAFDSAQAHVLLGQPGFKRDDPDYFLLLVGNYILGGGGFTSRLTHEVREQRGLSYSVSSSFAPALHAGAFTLGLQTRPDQAEQALQVVRDVLAKFVADGPTDAELQAAQSNLIGGFALRLDSNRKLLDNIANIAWNRLPLTYLDTWTEQVGQVTSAAVKAAFQRKLQPQSMATVVLGGKAALQK